MGVSWAEPGLAQSVSYSFEENESEIYSTHFPSYFAEMSCS